MILSKIKQPNSWDFGYVPGARYTDGPLYALPLPESNLSVFSIWYKNVELYPGERFRIKVTRKIIKDLYLLPINWNEFVEDFQRLKPENLKTLKEVLAQVRETAIAAFPYKPAKQKRPKKPLTDEQRFLAQRKKAVETLKGKFSYQECNINDEKGNTISGGWRLVWIPADEAEAKKGPCDTAIRVMDPNTCSKDLLRIERFLNRNAAYFEVDVFF